MRIQDLDHVVAAAAQIVSETEFVIVGSQAILGSFPNAPAGWGSPCRPGSARAGRQLSRGSRVLPRATRPDPFQAGRKP